MQQRKRPTPQSSYGKALVLLILLILIFVFSRRMTQHGLPSQIAAALNSSPTDYRRVSQFDDSAKAILKKDFAGFWEAIHPLSATNPLGTKDRLEFKDNGIIWRVKTYRLRAPRDSVLDFYHVMHGYVNPYGRFSDDAERIVCEVRIIRQVYILPADTCYGPSAVDLLWQARKGEGAFELDGFQYTPYGSMALDTFFPPRMINLIDDINVSECPLNLSFASWAKARIAEGLAGHAGKEAAAQLIANYYDPIFIADAGRRLRQSGMVLSDSAPVHLSIAWDGSVLRASLGGGLGRGLVDTLVSEVKTWRFTPRPPDSPPLDVQAVIHLQPRR